jgi:D-3-phosphoglycerate dehydrogenase
MNHSKPTTKVLVTDTVHQDLIDGLNQNGYHVEYRPKIPLAEVHSIAHQFVGMVINSKIIVDRVLLDKALHLKFVARLGSGLEIIDLDYCAQKKVAVIRSPDGNCDAVAEHAMAMLLSLAIKLRKSDFEVRNKIWNRESNRGWELMNKTVAILGFGYTGKAFAKRLSSFGVRILVYDKYLKGFGQSNPHVQESTMQAIFQQADVLSLHLPATSETNGLVDAHFLNQFAKKITLVNTSRGNIVQLKDLLKALDKKQLTGLALDVFENEKPETYSRDEENDYQNLFERSNVLLSPHVAGWTVESKKRLSKFLLNRIMML